MFKTRSTMCLITLYLLAATLFSVTPGTRQELNLQIQRTGGGQILLSWDQVGDATGYQIYSAAAPVSHDSPGWSLLIDLPPSAASYEINPDLSLAYFYMTYESDMPPVPEDFVYVHGGTFIMGDEHYSGYPWELPLHSVTLNHFLISKYEVTQSQYIALMGEWNSNPLGIGSFGVGDDYPVYWISWYSALKYCNMRSMAEGLTPVYTISGSTDPADWGPVSTEAYNAAWDVAICDWNANGYRLPTEAEWEYAARGATNVPDYIYSGSNDLNTVGWFAGNNSPNGTKTVGTKAPNSIGIHDMSGNVWEWCWDWRSESYYSSSPSENPTGPVSGYFRVVRGGGFGHTVSECRVTSRGGRYPYNYTSYYNGFRLCRSIP